MEEGPEEYPVTNTNSHWQLRWGHIFVAIIIIVLLAGTWILFHRGNTTDSGCTSVFNNACSSGGSAGKQKSSKQPSTANNKASNNAKPKTTPATPNNSSTTATNGQSLANTGPGDIVGLFFGVVLSGGALYSLRLRRHMDIDKESL